MLNSIHRLALAFLTCCPLILPAATRADDGAANVLFLQAAGLYEKAEGLTGEARAAHLSQVRGLLEEILREHPQSRTASEVRAGGRPAGMDLDDIGIEAASIGADLALRVTFGGSPAAVEAARQICGTEDVECAESLAQTLVDWLVETAIIKVAPLSIDPDAMDAFLSGQLEAVNSPHERIRLLDELIGNSEATNDLAKRLQQQTSDASWRDIGSDLAADFAYGLVAGYVSETLAEHYEAQGDTDAARFTRAAFEPLAEVITGAAAGGWSGLAATNVIIWSRNVHTMAVLGGELNEDRARGRDVAAQLKTLRENVESIHLTLAGNEVAGSFFTEEQQGLPVTENHREVLENILENFVRIEDDLIAQNATLNEGLTAMVASASRGLAAFVDRVLEMNDPLNPTTPALPPGLSADNRETDGFIGPPEDIQSDDAQPATSSQVGSGLDDKSPSQFWDERIVALPDAGAFSRTSPAMEDGIDDLRALGISDEAIAFSIAFSEATGLGEPGEFVAMDFQEYGAVDVVLVERSYTPNTPLVYSVLVSRDGTIRDIKLPTRNPRRAVASVFSDPTSRRLLAGGPDPWIVKYGIFGHRLLPSGNQRFIWTGYVSGSCRACESVGTAIGFIDVDADGRIVERHAIGIAPPSVTAQLEAELAREPGRSGWENADFAADPVALQYRLNTLGYAAGPMDGQIGPSTRGALEAFQAAHCLPTYGRLDGATLDALRANADEESACTDASPLAAAGPEASNVDTPAASRSSAPAQDPGATASKDLVGTPEDALATPPGTNWVQIASRADLSEAREMAQAAGDGARIFRARNGLYAITAALLSAPEFSGLQELISYNNWPEDSYLTSGEGYVEELPVMADGKPDQPSFTKTETLRKSRIFSRRWRNDRPIYDDAGILEAGEEVVVWGGADGQGDCLVSPNEGVFIKCRDVRGFGGSDAAAAGGATRLAEGEESAKAGSAPEPNKTVGFGPPVGSGPMQTLTSSSGKSASCRLRTALAGIDDFTWTGRCDDGMVAGAGQLEFFQAGMLQEMLYVGPGREMRIVDGALRWVNSFRWQLRTERNDSAFGGLVWASATFVVPVTFNVHSKTALDWLIREAVRQIRKRRFPCSVEARIGRTCYNLIVTSDLEAADRMRSEGDSIEGYPTNYVYVSLTPEFNVTVSGRSPVIVYGPAQKAFVKDVIARNIAASEALWADRMEAILDDADARVDNIADLLRFDEKATLAALADGRQVVVAPDDVAFREGAAIVIDTHESTDIYGDVLPERLVKKGFSWGDFLASAQRAGAAAQTSGVVVSCSTSIEEIPESGTIEDRTFDAILKSYRRGSVALTCSKSR